MEKNLFWRLSILMVTGAILLSNTSVPTKAAAYAPSFGEITYYEAENARFDGNPWRPGVGTYPAASGGTIVGEISPSNHIIFDVDVAEEGFYDVQVQYAGYDAYPFQFIVNEDFNAPVNFKTANVYSWGNYFGSVFTKVALKKGANTLRLLSTVTTRDTTDIRFDRIGISKSRESYDITLIGEALAPSEPNTMWFRSPATEWAESIPLGNGRIGSMVWGGVYEDTVSLNEVTCWTGGEHKDDGLDNPNGPENLKKLQSEMLKENPNRNVMNEYFNAMGGKRNDKFGTSRPFGRLLFNFGYEGAEINDYIRSLDLPTSMSYVSYTANGINFTREAFVSNPDQVMVMKYKGDVSGSVTFDVNFAIETVGGGIGKTTAEGNSLVFDGQVLLEDNGKSGVTTHGRMVAVNTGGTVSYDQYGIHVADADEVYLILALGTDFENDPKPICQEQISKALEKNYETMKNDHINDVRPRFNRMEFELGKRGENIPTNERLAKIRNGAPLDNDFVSLWYQYARYTMLAGSRENSPLPMHLQGIWNDNVACNMIWTCDYHVNINIQMNQWMSNSSNLSEGELPIFKFLKERLIPSGKRTAQIQYGKNGAPTEEDIGWTMGIVSNAWGYTGNQGSEPAWEGSTSSGAWLAQEIMNYFDHTWDLEFLEKDGLPMLKDTARFFLNYLIEHPKDGYLVTVPGSSPENGGLEIMPTYDRTSIYDTFEQVLRAYDILEIEPDTFYDDVKTALEKLPPYRISPKYGHLMEWMYSDEDNGSNDHRTTSNILGLFPYAQITQDKTPDIAKAALLSIERKFGRPTFEHTEWTCVNAQGFYARLNNGQKAYEYLEMLANTFTWPNLMSISPEGVGGAETDVYIIDGMLGMAEGTAQMLLQSHSDRIEFLPALPREWDEGSIKGMVARGAFEVDFEWQDYSLKSAKITSKAGNTCSIYKNTAANWTTLGVFRIDDEQLTPVSFIAGAANTLTFETEKGASYVLLRNDKSQLYPGAMINDSDSEIEWMGFSPNAPRGLGAYGNDAHFSQTDGAYFIYEFTGTGVDLYAETDASAANIEISIDDEEPMLCSLVTPQRIAQNVVFSKRDLPYGKHRIKAVSRITDDGKPYVVIDALAVHGHYGTFANDDSAQVVYSGAWGRSEGRNLGNAYENVHYTGEEGAKASISFTGTGIEVITERFNGYGSADIYMDGELIDTINSSIENTSHREVLWTALRVSGLPNEKHTLEIVAHGDGLFLLDGFIIRNTGGISLQSGIYEICDFDTGQALSQTETLEIAPKLGSGNQQWYFDRVGDSQYFYIKSAFSGKYLGINAGGSSAQVSFINDGSLEYDITPSFNQEDAFVIRHKKTGGYLQVDTGADWDGIGISPYYPQRDKHFNWIIEDLPNGRKILNTNSGTRVMEADDGEYPANIRDRVLTYTKHTNDSQRWIMEALGNNEFKIINLATNKCIGEQNDIATTVVWEDHPSNKWNLVRGMQNAKEFYRFENVESGNVLLEGKWILKIPSGTLDLTKTVPIALNLEAEQKGDIFTISYQYFNYAGIVEKDSQYSVYLLNSSTDSLTEPVSTGEISASEPKEVTIENASDKLVAIEIIPKAANGSAGESNVIYFKDYEVHENLQITDIIYTEDFETLPQEGWYSGGSEQYTLTTQQSGNSGNSLAFTPTTWWETMWHGLDFNSTSNPELNNLTGKVYVGFDAKFTVSPYPTDYFPHSSPYISLKNDAGLQFLTLRLYGYGFDVIALDDKKTSTVRYNIESGYDNVMEVWHTIGLYVDVENNTYQVTIDDKFVDSAEGITFYSSNNTDVGIAGTRNIGKINALEMVLSNSSGRCGIMLDNLEIGHYRVDEDLPWRVKSLRPVDYKIVPGMENEFKLIIEQKTSVPGGRAIMTLGDKRSYSLSEVNDIKIEDRLFQKEFVLDIPKESGSYILKTFLWDQKMEPLSLRTNRNKLRIN